MDPISNHTSGVSLHKPQVHGFFCQKHGGFSGKKPNKIRNISLLCANPRRVFGSLKLAASMPWIPKKSWMQGKINDSKGIPGMKNHFSGLESLLSERSKKGLLIFHLRKPPSLSIFKSSSLFQAALQECLMDIHSEACNFTGAGHFHPKTRIGILQASKRKHRALACHIVNVHWLNNGWMDWHTSHNARGQLNEVHLLKGIKKSNQKGAQVLLFRETAH